VEQIGQSVIEYIKYIEILLLYILSINWYNYTFVHCFMCNYFVWQKHAQDNETYKHIYFM
jgi:hypothetical protein